MNKCLHLLLIVGIMISFQTVSALEIESYKIIATPEGDAVENIIEISISNTKTTPLTQGTLHIAKDATLVSVKDSYGRMTYTTTEEETDTTVVFTFSIPVQPGDKRILTLETKTHNVVQKEGYFEYMLVFVPASSIDNFVHILKLDRDVELYNIKEEYLLVPDATIAETEEHIIIQWESQLTKDVPAVFLARFSQETGINYWKWVALSLLAILFIVVGSFSFQRYVGYYKQQKALKATNILNEREKAVLGLVIKNPEIKQYEIIKQLGYTKSNMSKIVKRLEFRGLISVKKEGKVRILSLGEKMKKGI